MICPVCGLDVKKPIKHFLFESIDIHGYTCPNCEHSFVGTRQGSEKRLCRPVTKLPAKIPPRIQELSPKAFRFYCDALNLKSVNMDNFAGAGLRMALENLLWEYLAKIKGIPEKELEDLQLTPMIQKLEELEPEVYKTACAKIVREFGNEQLHIRKDFPPISFNDALCAFELLCEYMNNYIGMTEIYQKFEVYDDQRKQKRKNKKKAQSSP